MKITVLTCDICNPHSDQNPKDGRGLLWGWNWLLAMKHAGWVRRWTIDGRALDVCDQCVDERRETKP